jgi:hypothetical protein
VAPRAPLIAPAATQPQQARHRHAKPCDGDDDPAIEPQAQRHQRQQPDRAGRPRMTPVDPGEGQRPERPPGAGADRRAGCDRVICHARRPPWQSGGRGGMRRVDAVHNRAQ